MKNTLQLPPIPTSIYNGPLKQTKKIYRYVFGHGRYIIWLSKKGKYNYEKEDKLYG